MIENSELLKKKLLDFTIQGVSKFLKKHPNLSFYAFAYDCNIEYAEVNLCFNTEDDFQKTLFEYQNGKYAEYYQTEEDIEDLKYNTGDWEYQCFDTIYLYSNEEIDEIMNQIPEDDYEKLNDFLEDMLLLVSEVLMDFTKTEVYAQIPKTEDFIAYTIDHDEDFIDARERMNKIQKK